MGNSGAAKAQARSRPAGVGEEGIKKHRVPSLVRPVPALA
jgi:hypothetical protein